MRQAIFTAATALFLLTLTTSVFAGNAGFGFFVSFGTGTLDLEDDRIAQDIYYGNGDSDNFSLGLLMDTAPMGEEIFNYRLSISYGKVDHEIDDVTSETDNYLRITDFGFDFTRIGIDNTFAFALHRGDRARVWLGPQIGLAIYTGDGNLSLRSNYYVNDYELEFDDGDPVLSLSAGPNFGVNYTTSSGVILGIDATYRFDFISSNVDIVNWDRDINSGGFSYEVMDRSFLINLSVLFGGGY